ncbi:MAG: hypothetical protein HY059_10000 [Proteobacteria bacterium]|nr:hypothetical protein [Pseudomonadota bacterium]
MAVAAAARPRWIVSARYDLTFFIGSAVLTFLLYALYRGAHRLGWLWGGDSILVTYFVFTALLDHPHIFQTFSRTHYDRAEFKKRRRLHTWGLGAFVAGGLALTAAGYERELIVVAALYGAWHIVRQHAGLLAAYKAVNGDHEPIDDGLDYGTFYTGMLACLFNDYSGQVGPVVVYKDLTAKFPALPPETGSYVWSAFLALLVLWGFRQTWRAMEGKAVNVPKLLLMAAALSTHYFVYFATATPFLVAEALETGFHNAQYQGWIMHFQRKRFPDVRAVALKWFAVAAAYGLAVGVVEILGLMNRGWAAWVFVPFSMVVLYHYFVDGLIWRFREEPELSRLLLSRVEPGTMIAPTRQDGGEAPCDPSRAGVRLLEIQKSG